MDIIVGIGQDVLVCFIVAAIVVGFIRVGQLFISNS